MQTKLSCVRVKKNRLSEHSSNKFVPRVNASTEIEQNPRRKHTTVSEEKDESSTDNVQTTPSNQTSCPEAPRTEKIVSKKSSPVTLENDTSAQTNSLGQLEGR